MAVKFEVLKANEDEIRKLAVQWMKSDCETAEHQDVERRLRQFGFTAWNLLSLFYEQLDYE